MRAVLTAALFLGAVPAVFAQDAQVAAGQKVYADQKCSVCHSIAGKGNAKGSLDGVGTRLTAEDIRSWIVDAKAMTAKHKPTRKPDMRAYNLPKGEVDALVAYLVSLKK